MNLADITNRAVESAAYEGGFYTKDAGDGVWYLWGDEKRGPATTKEGFIYLREGVLVKLDDCTVVVRAVVGNGMNAGEARLTGFAATNHDLIQGVIETALESI